MKNRQAVPFEQSARLKIKEDLLHKLSRDHRLKRWKEKAEWPFWGSGALPGTEESGEASPGKPQAMLGKQVRCCGDRCPSSFRGIRGSEGSAAVRRKKMLRGWGVGGDFLS